MRLGLDQPLKHFQAFVVAGGRRLSSVFTLLPGAPVWTNLTSLPRGLWDARAIIVAGGRLRVVGGEDDSYPSRSRSEVIFASLVTDNDLLFGRCSSIILHRGTSG